jgi:hypothetical protein
MTRAGQEQRTAGAAAEPNLRWALDNVAEALRGLRFGVVTLVIQDGVVVQVERTDRRRYQRGGEPATSRD